MEALEASMRRRRSRVVAVIEEREDLGRSRDEGVLAKRLRELGPVVAVEGGGGDEVLSQLQRTARQCIETAGNGVLAAFAKAPVSGYPVLMSSDVEHLFMEAMELPQDERAALAAIPEDSLGDGSSEEELAAAWTAEIQRRLATVRSGEVELIPTEEVERELEQILEQAEEPQRAVG